MDTDSFVYEIDKYDFCNTAKDGKRTFHYQ